MPRLLFLVCVITLLAFGCSQKGSSPSAPLATKPAAGTITNDVGQAPGVVAAADMSTVLAALTQALRKFSVEQRRVPNSLNELVAPGYLPALPQAPPGKTFAIDTKNLQVYLK